MRLTPAQRIQLLETIQDLFGPQTEVKLFGSRTDDTRRGGDFDIFIETTLKDATELVQRKLKCLARLHATPEFDGEKIDLVVASQIDGAELPIHRIARIEGIRL
jgi:predicted nucleotidyltransferase